MTQPIDDIEVINFGCRLNIAEGEAVHAAATQADIGAAVIINSCAVTAEAERQVRQTIRRTARTRPNVAIYVTGCAADIARDKLTTMPEVTYLIPNRQKTHMATYRDVTANRNGSVDSLYGSADSLQGEVEGLQGERGLQGSVGSLYEDVGSLAKSGDSSQQDECIVTPGVVSLAGFVPFAPIVSGSSYNRAFVAVQNGCDHSCTFCIIPRGRGKSRSAPIADCVRAIAQATAQGHKEVILSGVDLTGYGQDLAEQPVLGQLVADILREVPQLPRLRLSSLDASEIDPLLFEIITSEPRLMPHVHLSLQSGDDMILKRMKRRHRRRDAVRLVERLKGARADIAIGADLIAGFPTESEAMFANSLRLVEECDIVYGHIFPYSPRAGTPAVCMPQVERHIARARAAQLRAACAGRRAALQQRMLGSVQRILVEGDGVHGYAENYMRLALAKPRPAGSVQKVHLRASLPSDRDRARANADTGTDTPLAYLAQAAQG